MSTGFECYFRETAPGEWFYVLQDADCPVGAWDWREHATAYGPFASEELAEAHMDDYQANPGGWWTDHYVEGYKPDEVEAKLFASARKRPLTEIAW